MDWLEYDWEAWRLLCWWPEGIPGSDSELEIHMYQSKPGVYLIQDQDTTDPKDIIAGPFDTLEAAKIAFELMYAGGIRNAEDAQEA